MFTPKNSSGIVGIEFGDLCIFVAGFEEGLTCPVYDIIMEVYYPDSCLFFTEEEIEKLWKDVLRTHCDMFMERKAIFPLVLNSGLRMVGIAEFTDDFDFCFPLNSEGRGLINVGSRMLAIYMSRDEDLPINLSGAVAFLPIKS